ncbi:hypothetical protein [Vulcanisaeta sp. JCM 16159]|uniref:hypothetical protein n=1 Tax=Vulcanisaeta sp. JCM 16159 TaxID=1295371 RepID=UPI0006D017DA|nr:hypothetical protein [Vulcanisaeta sp. JCM 16159]
MELDVGAIIVATGASPVNAVNYNAGDGLNIVTIHDLVNRGLSVGNDVLLIDLCNKPYCQAIMFNTALALRRTGKNVYVVVRDVMMVGTQYEDLYREVRRAGVTILRVPRDGDVMNYVVLDHDTA